MLETEKHDCIFATYTADDIDGENIRGLSVTVRLTFLSVLIWFTAGCSKPEALKQPPPKRVEVQQPEPEPVVAPIVRTELSVIELGNYIVVPTQVGRLEPGGRAVFELMLFDAMQTPDTVTAWLGPSLHKAAEVKGQATFNSATQNYDLQLQLGETLPEPKLWLSMKLDNGKTVKGSTEVAVFLQ